MYFKNFSYFLLKSRFVFKNFNISLNKILFFIGRNIFYLFLSEKLNNYIQTKLDYIILQKKELVFIDKIIGPLISIFSIGLYIYVYDYSSIIFLNYKNIKNYSLITKFFIIYGSNSFTKCFINNINFNIHLLPKKFYIFKMKLTTFNNEYLQKILSNFFNLSTNIYIYITLYLIYFFILKPKNSFLMDLMNGLNYLYKNLLYNNILQYIDIKKINIDNMDCSICYNNFRNPIKINNCNHIFCEECIYAWLSQKNSCPICRQYIII